MLTRPMPTAADPEANPYATLTPDELETVRQDLTNMQAKLASMRAQLEAWLAGAKAEHGAFIDGALAVAETKLAIARGLVTVDAALSDCEVGA